MQGHLKPDRLPETHPDRLEIRERRDGQKRQPDQVQAGHVHEVWRAVERERVVRLQMSTRKACPRLCC